ncbi:hypothetical protein NLG97_g9521 [Lecanicillium saksenae]|uniref:Uncharacterized protein n=1 Tax=Lecanicillium saksenae TaxID=468837 RepID=A0ACC1QHF8_9HYPO|nr:hypothetical protein NLG97_g9521 [Lecanicillium saksenae]
MSAPAADPPLDPGQNGGAEENRGRRLRFDRDTGAIVEGSSDDGTADLDSGFQFICIPCLHFNLEKITIKGPYRHFCDTCKQRYVATFAILEDVEEDTVTPINTEATLVSFQNSPALPRSRMPLRGRGLSLALAATATVILEVSFMASGMHRREYSQAAREGLTELLQTASASIDASINHTQGDIDAPERNECNPS